jgi:hypothetical protein
MVTADGHKYEFEEESWTTRCLVYKTPSSDMNQPELVEFHDSVTMPEFNPETKRAKFQMLPGMGGKNPVRDVEIDYVYAEIN